MMARIVVIFAIAMLFAVPAFGQGLGSHIKKSRDARTDIHDNDPNAAEKAVHFVGRCFADMRSPIAKKILALPYLEKDQKKMVKSKVSGNGGSECMGRVGFKLRFSYPPMIGGMADFYVTDVYSDDLIDKLADAPQSVQPRNSIESFSQCVVRKNPRAIKTFVAAPPTSNSEKQALQSVVPLLGSCIPAGEEIKLDRIALRAMLSFGLYQELTGYSSANVTAGTQ
ncbi:MAG: hypothetical protein Pars2KO_19420 [Parasphingorhabdus sp.]